MLLSLFLVGPYACFFNFSKTALDHPGKDIASRQIQYMQARRRDFFESDFS
jgi:hypothetical protein